MTKTNLFPIFLIYGFILIVLGILNSQAAPSKDINSINITKDNFYQFQPNIYKNKIVWVDLRHNTEEKYRKQLIPHTPCVSDIYLFDIKTKEIKRIIKTKTWKENLQISDNYVTWAERSNMDLFENERTVLRNLNTGHEQYFTLSDGWGWKLLQDDKLIYINNGIYMIDLQNNEKTKLVPQKPGHYTSIRNIDASNSFLIWLEEFRESATGRIGAKIYALNIKEKKEMAIGEYKTAYGTPEIYANELVWAKFEKIDTDKPALEYQHYDIYLTELPEGGIEKIISSVDEREVTPHIDGEYITYVNLKDNSYGIYNLITHQTNTIKPKWTFSPYRGLKISNKYVVWQDKGDIYYSSLE